MIPGLTNLQEHYPKKHRFQYNAVLDHRWWSLQSVAWWCSEHFKDEAALKMYLRIVRKAGWSQVQLSREFTFSDFETQVRKHGVEWIGRQILGW